MSIDFKQLLMKVLAAPSKRNLKRREFRLEKLELKFFKPAYITIKIDSII
jgi:hypothetical protein